MPKCCKRGSLGTPFPQNPVQIPSIGGTVKEQKVVLSKELEQRRKIPWIKWTALSDYMPPKNTAKKRAAGGSAIKISGPLGSLAVFSVPASPLSAEEAEVVQPDVHSPWCLICYDGTEGDVVLYECNTCPQCYTNDYKGFYKGSLLVQGGEPAL
ncbi:hypothetical protein BDR05DRAFT_952119 [Suillus weaverae]|nr:hypothetical protein BDR05DRAFT_952119 [Suillus weaverae]